MVGGDDINGSKSDSALGGEKGFKGDGAVDYKWCYTIVGSIVAH
jgi:hypothetical protein